MPIGRIYNATIEIIPQRPKIKITRPKRPKKKPLTEEQKIQHYNYYSELARQRRFQKKYFSEYAFQDD